MIRGNRILSACVLLLLLPSIGLAAPAINGITGEISDNQKITITGSGFGAKSPAAPIIWADFENGSINPSPLGQKNSWNDIQNLELSSSNQGSGSSFNVAGTWDSNSDKRSFSFRVDKSVWTKIYHYQKRYFTFDITGNQKYWRLWPSSGPNNFLALWHGSSGMAYNEGEGGVGGSIGGYQGSALSKNNWHTEEFIWQHSGGSGLNSDGTRGSGTGIWDYTVNGTQNQHRENVNNGASNHTGLRIDNFTDSNYLAPNGSKVHMDDIYIDDTYARVMIGDASTIGASRHREIQIPSVWSDGSATVTVNQGSFRAGDQAYLFVFNSSGQVNQTGYPVQIGATPAPAPTPLPEEPPVIITEPTEPAEPTVPTDPAPVEPAPAAPSVPQNLRIVG